MNIGIVIGVSEYDNLNNLPSCDNDAKLIYDILKSSSKYEEVLLLNENTTSKQIKDHIIEFTEKYKDQDINEFFIYFSGHGYFDGNNFYYIFSNYDQEKLKRTTLENSELDIYIKRLNPTLTVKVIDSCQSGTKYIKDVSSFQEYIKKDTLSFDSCYFLYSSQNNQSSYADNHISFFTKVLIESLIDMDIGSIRYKDIIDYISDSFIDNVEQQPYFVTQADFTEEFISMNQELKEKLQSNLIVNIIEIPEDEKKSLLDYVCEDSKKYFKKEDVSQIFFDIQKTVQKFKFQEDNFQDLFETSIDFKEEYIGVPRISKIATWVHKNKKDYFVQFIYGKKIVKRRVPKNGLTTIGAMMRSIGEKIEYETKDVETSLPVTIESTTELEYNYIFIKNKPNFPNLYSTTCIILPIVSKTKILFFTTFFTYENIGWNEEKINLDSVDWEETHIDLNSDTEILTFINDTLSYFMLFTLEEVKKVVNFVEIKDDEKDMVTNLNTDSPQDSN